MDRGGEAGGTSDRDVFEGTRGGVFRYAEQYKQSGIDVLKLRTMDRGEEARYASDRDEEEGTRGGAFRYAE